MAFLNLKAVLGLDGSGFQIGMKKADSVASKFSSNFKGQVASAFGTAAVIAYTKKVIDAADELIDLSDRLDITTDSLQEWFYAAKKNSASKEDVVAFFEKIAEARDNALKGNKEAIESFKKLGVSITDLKTKRTEQIGAIIAGTIKSGDSQTLSAPLRDVGGKSATKLIPSFKSGLDDMAKQARGLGQVISTETLMALKESKQQFEALADSLMGPVASALTGLMRGLETVVDFMKAAAASLGTTFGTLYAKIESFVKNNSATDIAGKLSGIKYLADKIYGNKEETNITDDLKSAGKAIYDAFDKGADAFIEVMKEAVKRDQARAEAALKRDSDIRNKGINQQLNPLQETGKRESPQVNELQRVGALVMDRPQITELRRISKNTMDIVKNTAARNVGGWSKPAMEGDFA